MIDAIVSTLIPILVVAVVAAIGVLRVRAGRVQDFDRTPMQARIVSAVNVSVIVLGVAIVAFVVVTMVAGVLALPWGDLASRITDRGGWVIVLGAFVLLVAVLVLTPAWFRPAHMRAMRDDEPSYDSSGRRKGPTTFDTTGRTYPDGTGLDPRA